MQVHHDVEGTDISSSNDNNSTSAPVAGGFSFMKNNVAENNDSMRASATSGRSALSALVSSPATQTSFNSRGESSSTAKMQRVVADLEEASRTNRMRLADLKIRARQLAENEKERSAEVEKLKAKVAEASAKQDEAIRHEQFEEAERLNEALDAAKGSLTAAEGRRMHVLQLKAEVEANQQQVFAEARAASTLALQGLKVYGEERSIALSSFRKQVYTTHTSLNEKLTSDEEQAQLKAKHVQAETLTVESEARQVESIISEQTGELVKLSAEVKEKHAILTGEVLELERLLEAKRREERAAALQLDEYEQKIKQIAAKFDKQHVRLQTRREHIDNERAECAREAAEIAKAKAEFASSRKRDRRTERDLLAQLTHNSADVAIAESLNVALCAQDERRSELASQSLSAHSALSKSLEAVEECLRATRTTESRKAALEAQASGHNKTIHNIDASIPALNEEKKRAVADKKFKEAGRINDELKRLSDQREEAVKELSTCTTGVDAAEAELSGAGATLTALRSAALSTERTSDLERCELLKKAIRALSIQVRNLSKSRRKAILTPTVTEIDAQTLVPLASNSEAEVAEDEAQASTLAIEINKDTGMSSIQHAAVELLSAERDLLLEELNILCARHGVSSDIGQLPAQEEEEEEKKKIETTQSASIPVSAAAAATTTTFVAESIVSVIPGVLSFESTPSTIVETLDSGFNASSTSSSSSTSAFDDSSDLFRRLNSDKVPALDGLLSEPVDSFNNQQESTSDTVPVGISVSSPLSEEARQAELASIALALSSVEASLREKELLIEQFVSQENYDEADKIQVDLDSLLAHKESLIRREEELNQ
jgi:IgA-specific serine endopeptidase